MAKSILILNHNDPKRGVWLFSNPNVPYVKKPNWLEKIYLKVYHDGLLNQLELIQQMQKEIPGWLPPFCVPGRGLVPYPTVKEAKKLK